MTAGAGIRGGVIVVPVVTTGLHCGAMVLLRTARGSFQSSPSSRRGSIAAPTPTSWSRSWTGRPRRHDGAPLRRRFPRLPERPDHRVVPVVTTGLHCGGGGQGPGGPGPMSSPSSRRGSIAAPIPGGGQPHVRLVVPVVTTGLHCGVMGSPDAFVAYTVVPVVTTGLHCGSSESEGGDSTTVVVPVVTTGLHCGQYGGDTRCS